MHMLSFCHSYFILHTPDRSAREAANGDQESDEDSTSYISTFTHDN